LGQASNLKLADRHSWLVVRMVVGGLPISFQRHPVYREIRGQMWPLVTVGDEKP
jgi:hypothetical protein